MLQNPKQVIRKQYQHIFNSTQVGEDRNFQIQLIDYLCKNPSQRKQFIKNPTAFLKDIQKYLTSSQQIISFEDFIKLYQINIVFKKIPYMSAIYKKFDQITNEKCIGKWIVLSGTIIQSTQVNLVQNKKKTLQKSKIFKCDQCGQEYRVENSYHNSYRFEMPGPCQKVVEKEKTNNMFTKLIQNFAKKKDSVDEKKEKQTKMGKCGSFKFTPQEAQKVCIDYQQFRIQEHFKHIESGKMPQNLTVIIEGAMSSNFRPGDDVTISGILDYRYKKPAKDMKMNCQLIIFANTISLQKQNLVQEIQDKQSVTDVSVSEYSLLRELSLSQNMPEMVIVRQLKYRNEVVQSFAPNIFGRHNVKLGLILALLGGVSYKNQNSKLRGQSHVLLIGDPGTGKSVLIQQASSLSDRSFFTNGIGTSSAGLSVSYYKDGNDWTIEAGALVLADNGICVIDELTLLAKKDEQSLLEAMQQQTISSAKASVVGKFNARTTVIAACNPITPGQKYNHDIDLQANTGLSLPLLTRFDLILILNDQNDQHQDSKKCDYILQNFCEEKFSFKPATKKNFLPLKPLLKKCRLYSPQLSSNKVLSIYYTNQRLNSNRQHLKTARAFQSLCRLTEAHAKLMMREKTTALDCMAAILTSENKYFSTFEEYFVALQEFANHFKIDMSELMEGTQTQSNSMGF